LAAFSALTFAEWAYVTALAIDAFRLGGAVAVGVVGLRLLAGAAASFASVALVERQAGRQLLSAIAAVRAAIVLASAALAASGAPLAPLVVLVMVDAVVAAPYRPAQAARLAASARTPTELAAAAAGTSTVKTLSQAVGAAAGGALLAVTTPATVFCIAGAVFIVAAVATVERGGARPRAARRARAGIAARETLQLIRTSHVGGIVVVSGLRSLVRGMWVALAVIVSLRLLHAGSAGVGLLMLAAGVGALTAVPLSTALITRSRIGTPTAVALIACGAPLAVVAGVPFLDVAVVFVVAWGVGMAVADVGASALLYRLLETPRLPRVTGVIESAKLALEGCGAFLAPVLASAFGVRAALVIAAAPLPIVVLAGWRMLHRVDALANERRQVLGLLHEVPCLEPLDVVSLEYLAASAARMQVASGSDVVRQGDPGDRFYVVVDGTADVLLDGYVVGAVGPGGSFGERALLRDEVRAATVRSTTPMHLLAIARADFLGAVDEPGGARVPSVALRAGTVRERADALARVSLFSHLGAEALGRLAAGSVVEHWPEGAAVVRQGEAGDRFYVVLDGQAIVESAGEVVAELRPGDQFGEIALLHDVPRRADVTAASSLTTLSLGRDDFLPAVRSRLVLG
jgi:CRP-like cAMP-binding protein